MRVRKARKKDFKQIIPVIIEAFEYDKDSFAKTEKRFEPLFNHKWAGKDDRGYVLEVENEIVGFIGCVYSTRTINGKTHRFCNCSTWVVKKDYRKYSLMLIEKITKQKNLTVTIFTPRKITHAIFNRLFGYPNLDNHLLYIPNKNEKLNKEIQFTTDVKVLSEKIGIEDCEKMEAHLNHEANFLLLEKGKESCFCIFNKQIIEGEVQLQFYYINNKAFFSTQANQVSTFLSSKYDAKAIFMDGRFIKKSLRQKDWIVKPLANPRIFFSTDLAPEDIDGLYSEYFLVAGLRA